MLGWSKSSIINNMNLTQMAAVLLPILLLPSSQTFADRPPHIDEEGGREAQLQALAKFEDEIDAAFQLPPTERFPLIGTMLRKLSRQNIFQVERRQTVYEATLQRYLETPGHAHYYRDRILEAKAKAFTDGQPKTEPAYSDYLTERGTSLQTLALLPSVETMEVLMAFLDDHDRPSGEPGDLGYFNPLSLQITPILEQLLEDPAPRGTSWLDWRDEVRRGQRTFRFKGSEIRYNFVGPAPDKVTRPPKPLPSEASGHSPSDSGEQPNRGNTTPDPHPARNTIAALAGTLLLLSLLWWAYTKRSKNHL